MDLFVIDGVQRSAWGGKADPLPKTPVLRSTG
jgi:hypothetical protein